MGPLMVAMPRTNYQTGSSSLSVNTEEATSRLIGGEKEEEETLGSQMAARLSKHLQLPVFCSPNLSPKQPGSEFMSSSPIEAVLLHQRIAALVEHEVKRLLHDVIPKKE